MKKALKIILIGLVLCVLGYSVFYFLASKGIIPVNVVPGARTIYEGQVGIETVSFSELESQLKKGNIYYTFEGGTLEIYPHGPGFGPVSFTVTGSTLKAFKDIDGTPDPKKYKEEVRQDVKDIGGIIRIKEDTWKIIKVTYPVTAVY